MESNLRPGNLLHFSLRDKSMKLVDEKIETGELQFAGKLNRTCTFADSHSKVSDGFTMHRFK
jgi:snurportin-1